MQAQAFLRRPPQRAVQPRGRICETKSDHGLRRNEKGSPPILMTCDPPGCKADKDRLASHDEHLTIDSRGLP